MSTLVVNKIEYRIIHGQRSIIVIWSDGSISGAFTADQYRPFDKYSGKHYIDPKDGTKYFQPKVKVSLEDDDK